MIGFWMISNKTPNPQTSLNAEINSILAKYVRFYKHTAKTGCTIIPPNVYSFCLDAIDEEKMIEVIKKYGYDSYGSLFSHSNIPMTRENLIRICFEEVAIWSGACSFFDQRLDEQGNTWLVFDHRYGIKWSRILASAYSEMIQQTLQRPTEQNYTYIPR